MSCALGLFVLKPKSIRLLIIVLIPYMLDVIGTHYCPFVQSSDGGFRVSVITPSPVDLTDQMGERVRVAGIMLPTGGPPTLMLPMGTEVGSAVVLCSQNSHARHLLNGHLYGKGASEDTGGEPCKPCNWFR